MKRWMVAAVAALAASAPFPRARAAGEAPPAAAPLPEPAPERRLEINEYRVLGATRLSPEDLDAALAPFLGPDRVLSDVEAARAALEKAYLDRGWHTVLVAIPQQTVRDGIVHLEVTEGRIARLRVKNARWFSPQEVRRLAPSVAEGESPNFNAIVRDIYVLNQVPDRRVTPSIRAGPVPGTVLVDLEVEDRIPLHASLEVNDRYSQGTTPLRLSAAVRDENLFQRGHVLSFMAQTAPERPDDGQVFSVSYLARIPSVPWVSFTGSAMFQDSDVATVGGVTVLGRGRTAGGRVTFTLSQPSAEWFQTATLGLDYKHYYEGVRLGGSAIQTPITYYPVTAGLFAAWQGETSRSSFDVSAVLNARGIGSGTDAYDQKRYQATGSFAYLRVEATRGDGLGGGWELTGRLRLQLTDAPLVAPEMFVLGGADTVRGYVEARAVGDGGVNAQLELWTPSVSKWLGSRQLDDWRFLAFGDFGWTKVNLPLPEQVWHFGLAGAGVGTRLKAWRHAHASVDLGIPLVSVAGTPAGDLRVHFRLWTEW